MSVRLLYFGGDRSRTRWYSDCGVLKQVAHLLCDVPVDLTRRQSANGVELSPVSTNLDPAEGYSSDPARVLEDSLAKPR